MSNKKIAASQNHFFTTKPDPGDWFPLDLLFWLRMDPMATLSMNASIEKQFLVMRTVRKSERGSLMPGSAICGKVKFPEGLEF